MAHLLSSAFQDAFGICQFASLKKPQVHMILDHADVANGILHPGCRAVMERDDIHFENVLAAGRHLFKHQLTQRNRKFLDSPVVSLE